jgi:hypothetical protein
MWAITGDVDHTLHQGRGGSRSVRLQRDLGPLLASCQIEDDEPLCVGGDADDVSQVTI